MRQYVPEATDHTPHPQEAMQDERSFQQQLALLHTAYLQQLPEKVETIVVLWQALSTGQVVQETATQLHHHVHKLCGSSPTFGLDELAAHLQYLEKWLKCYQADGVPLTPNDQRRIDADLSRARQLARQARQKEQVPTTEAGDFLSPTPLHALPQSPVVLIAEDEEFLRKKVTLSLEQAGCRVVEAEDGLMALLQARKHRPDLILLDYLMPGMDGSETVQRIREEPALQATSIFLMTTASRIEDVRLLLTCAVDGYLAKPVDATHVIDYLRVMFHPAEAVDAPPAPPVAQRILVVDDDVYFRRQLSILLKEAGYQVDEASDGMTAMQRVRLHAPDLVLMDVMMPVFDGFETTRMLRSEMNAEDTSIILLTSRVRTHDISKALATGADAYIAKPHAVTHLAEKVAAYLEL